MPTNLPPEYFEAEERYKQAKSPSEKIVALENLIATIPKHKGTDKLRASLRRRLSQHRKEAVSKKGGSRTDLYTVPKEGAAQIALVGFPNAGKSSLLASLTNAMPVIADYTLSTVMPLPGMMPYEDIQFQLVDLPPVGNESTDGWLSGIIRYADTLLLILDLSDDPDIQADLLIEQLERWNIYLEAFAEEDAAENAQQRGVKKEALLVGNKSDMPEAGPGYDKLRDKHGNHFTCLSVSALKKENLEALKQEIFSISGIIRVYAKPPGKDADLSTPFSIPNGSTTLDLARIIHKDFISNLKFARIWGSARFDGQRVEKNYILKDRDIVEFHLS
jgi:ribosome-interacting GTPase 1